MHRISFALAIVVFQAIHLQAGEHHRAIPDGAVLNDVRLGPLKDLNGYFPFVVPKTVKEWETRSAWVRRQILVSQGLWPMPTRMPLNAVIHGKIEFEDYTVENAFFESTPGFFVTGNLYRPTKIQGKVPGVLFAHGHWQDARFFDQNEELTRKEIATGAERFEVGGKSRFQSMCVQLARMGCVVWQWDMLSDSDSIQIPREVIHKFAKQRPEMNTQKNWGLFSPPAEAHLQSVMGLQTWNAVRALDFLLSLPEVDPDRTAITGASGGGTQTMLLAAIDSRIKLSFPAVMVSTEMQGGCTCENASLLRVNTGNIEFAALFAPKPQGMTTANDWTKEMSTKGFPEIQKIYKLLGASKNVMLQRGEHFPHNYNAVTRSAFYTWLNQHFKLGLEAPVIERDYTLLSKDQLTVWNAEHPSPKAKDPDFERSLLKWFYEDAQKQLQSSLTSFEKFKHEVGGGIEAIVGRPYDKAGIVEWKLTAKEDFETYVEMAGLLTNTTYGEELPVLWLYPKNWNGEAVVWLDQEGKSGLFQKDGRMKAPVQSLVDRGFTVLGADLLLQGESSMGDGNNVVQQRVVDNPREFAGYTFGYNDCLFTQRVHDVMTLVTFLRSTKVGNHPHPSSVSVVGVNQTGALLAAARSIIGNAIDRAAIDTQGFRFGSVLDYRDPQFLPGGAKYLDAPGLLALSAPNALWLAGESSKSSVVKNAYRLAGREDRFTEPSEASNDSESAAVDWLLSTK
ncbi:MAG: acetylxylan esterase [Pirellulaceae bacterium]|nr:acetylxylan esterase [Pirellulaceae bacterium]